MIISVPTEIFIFCFYRLYHIEPKIGPTARWIVIHTPNTAAARPQALGLMPTLNQPNVLESEPGARATNLARLITSPATISIPAKARIEREAVRRRLSERVLRRLAGLEWVLSTIAATRARDQGTNPP